MIDEFSLGLAPPAFEMLGDAMLEINRTGLTIVLVEQDVPTAFELASQARVIETGRVSLSGPTAELAEDPRVGRVHTGI